MRIRTIKISISTWNKLMILKKQKSSGKWETLDDTISRMLKQASMGER